MLTALISAAALTLTACGGGSANTAAAPAPTATQSQAEIDAQVQEALGGEAIAVTAPGTYTGGTDVASGIWVRTPPTDNSSQPTM